MPNAIFLSRPRTLLTRFLLLYLLLLSGCNGPKPNEQPAVSPPVPPVTGVAAGPEVPVKFTDVTTAAGIAFQHQSSKTPRKYLIETMGSGGAFLDYDRDGKLDILLLNNTLLPQGKVTGRPHLKLYRNLGHEKFEDVTAKVGLDKADLYAMGVTVGDYDRDGWPDIYITCALDSCHLYRNVNGKFQEVTTQAGVANKGHWGTSCAWVDYDKDGWLDLFVCNYVQYRSLKDDQPCYAGDKLVYCIPSAYEKSTCTLYHNEKNGKFRDVTVESGIAEARGKSLGVAIQDYNNDGWPDIFVANDTVAGFLFRNEGNGKFKEVGVETGVAYNEEGIPHSGMGIDAADYRNDGKTALVITNYFGQQTSFYDQTATDIFVDERHRTGVGEETRKVLGFGLLFFDYDNDGWKDLVQVNGHVQDDVEKRELDTPYAEPTLLFRNQGNGTFVEVGQKTGAPFTDRIVGRGVAWGDYNNDGKLDLLIMPNNGKAGLWRNDTPTQGHWIAFTLKSGKSAPDGIGAVVMVTAGGMKQQSMVRTASSYLSQSDLRPHFGLGLQTRTDVEIHWPSGTVDTLKGLAADRFYTVKEGAGKAE